MKVQDIVKNHIIREKCQVKMTGKIMNLNRKPNINAKNLTRTDVGKN